MRLRSKRSPKSEKAETDSTLGSYPMVEHTDCVESADDYLELGSSGGRKSIILEGENAAGNMGDKVLSLGFEVLDSIKDSVVSCPQREIGEEGVEFAAGETSVCVEDGKESVCIALNDSDTGVKEETTSPECKNRSDYDGYDRMIVSGDEDKKASDAIFEDCLHDSENADAGTVEEGDGGMVRLEARKRGRKRKKPESSRCNGVDGANKEKTQKQEVEVSGRVLRSRITPVSVSGSKRNNEAEPFDESAPQKKLKRRGRPPKLPTKLKRRGRPPKVQAKEMVSQKNRLKDVAFKKHKRLGRPPKVQAENLDTTKKPKKLMVVDETSNQFKARDIEKVPKVEVRSLEENKDQTTTEDPVEEGKGVINEELKKKNCSESGAERRKKVQLLREKIVDILLKAGWTIEYRPRQQRDYLDAVYVDPRGKTNWSITKAYRSLKTQIEVGEADSKEVSAFTPIPEEEMSILFRQVTKVRSDKNKKKNKIGKNVSKAEIVFSEETPPKKKPNKKSKDDSKKKKIQTSAMRLAKKSSDVKVRGNKPRGQPKLSQSRKPRLLARNSGKGPDHEKDSYAIYTGKRNILSWMIGLGVVLPGGVLHYGESRRKKGTITSEGVRCACCNETMGLSSFVLHGGGKTSDSFENLYLESGTSLLKCLLDSWGKEEEARGVRFNLVDIKGDDHNDDTCNICGDGGDLICCDGCPSTFHQSCLGIQNFPSGDWHCIYCLCKFCGLVSGTSPQADLVHGAVTSEMLSCTLCEERFHQSCLQEEDTINMDSHLSFCGRKCHEIYEQLQTYIGVKFELEDGFSWTLLKHCDVSQDSTPYDTRDKVECNSKLAVAFFVMDECFVPIVDERSQTNMIQNVVYNCGSNFRRLNYAGFFTVILERDEEMISAASIRIHGHQLAEMPFIGTRHMYRRQGMCRRLLDAIESALVSLGVEELVIPAISELFETWTKVFDFKPIEESQRQSIKSMSMIVFPGTDMLHKTLLKDHFSDGNLSPTAAVKPKSRNAEDHEREGEATKIETTKTQSANGVEDLLKNITCEAPEVPSDYPNESLANEPKMVGQLSSSMAYLSCGLGSSQSGVENDGVIGFQAKNTFDLNLHPSAIDECLSSEPLVCTNSNSQPPGSQPLVLV